MSVTGPGLDVDAVAAEVFGLLGTGAQAQPFSDRYADFDLPAAYRVAARVRELRMARGETPIGRKVGFTNRRIWDEYRVWAPIWGPVYDTTVRELAGVADGFSLAGLAEPRIEPEIILGMAAAPDASMDDARLFGCIGWVAHGFELVQSIYPGWTFTAPDTVVAYGLHGALLVGPRVPVAPDAQGWRAALQSFGIDLLRDGQLMDQGSALHVLDDGPVAAVRHLVRVLQADPAQPRLAAGEMVTTGTLTRALPVAPGQTWSTRLHGIDLPGAAVRFV
jgi:2-oxo-3-hexenedioate decarboxylase